VKTKLRWDKGFGDSPKRIETCPSVLFGFVSQASTLFPTSMTKCRGWSVC
jgi:hypothetical protein